MNKVPSRRKVAHHPDWQRIKASRLAVLDLDEKHFRGVVALLYIDEVTEPFSVSYDGQSLCILDQGYSWLRHFPVGSQYIMTTTFSPDGQVLQWYIDLCQSHGVTEEGIPWWDDLYLDIAILPSGKLFVLDADELDEALDQGVISSKEHAAVCQEAQYLVELVREERFEILRVAEGHRRQLLPLLRHR